MFLARESNIKDLSFKMLAVDRTVAINAIKIVNVLHKRGRVDFCQN